MTAEERARRAGLLCRRLEEDLTREIAREVLDWAPAADLVSGVSAGFLIALTAWEAEPSPAALSRARAAYTAVMAAWREAGQRYEAREATP